MCQVTSTQGPIMMPVRYSCMMSLYIRVNSDEGSDKHWGRTVHWKNTLCPNFVLQTNKRMTARLKMGDGARIKAYNNCKKH